MPLSTAVIDIELLMDVTNFVAKIHDLMTARAFKAVHNPAQGPEVRRVLEESVGVLDRPSAHGVI